MQTTLIRLLLVTALLLGLPMLGILLSDADPTLYLEFPPRSRYVVHAAFSWPIFVLTAMVGLMTLAMLIWLLHRDRRARSFTQAAPGQWPPWGWLGLALVGGGWVLAWSRFAWFSDWQWATFTPLWLGYILVINALTLRRSGRCLLLNERRYFFTLFPLSALFWWYFEYLNRFVQNWFYLGVDDFSAERYVLHATIAFSTVLPAVMSTQRWLAAMLMPARSPLVLAVSRNTIQKSAWLALLLSAIGLVTLGLWPNLLFPLLWTAPLLLLLGLQGLYGEPDLLRELRSRGWQTIYLPALAALQCGFFWELWNYHSAAKWIYTVPFVQRFTVFEMPVVGFTGYLPFGIECLAIALMLKPLRNS